MQAVQTQLPMGMPILPTGGTNDQFGGMGGLTGLILGGALFGRNGGLFGNNDAGAAAVATNNSLDAINARFNDLSQQNQTTSMTSGFSGISQELSALNIASMQQAHTNALAMQQCCCDNKVAAERINANIAASEARLGLQICQTSNDTNRLIENSKTEILMAAKDNIVTNLQNQIQQQTAQGIQNQMNNGFNNIAQTNQQILATLAVIAQSLSNKGNGNG